MENWRNFKEGQWQHQIDVANFIHLNYTPYEGNESFLVGPTDKTTKLWDTCLDLRAVERKKGGVLDVDTTKPTTITSHSPGYIQKDLELIYGLQTEFPLRRAVNPFGGLKMAKQSCEAYGYKLSSEIEEIFSKYRTTHNDGVFSAYTDEMKKARKSGVITGLPDSYGRGRIIGDYRRVALYGVDKLIEEKKKDYKDLDKMPSIDEMIRLREEITQQIHALRDLKDMARSYGFDLSKPAYNTKEAIQWTYFAYLGSIKESNGAANSLGKVSSFFDIYIERDFAEGTLTEVEAQELFDQFVIKLRLVRHLRTPEYDELFAGDPVWVTECVGGVTCEGQHMVTKSSYRMLHTLYNLGPSPEPNLTVLWSNNLPENFKKYCAKVSIDTSSIQYESADLMNPQWGEDCGVACCVSGVGIGKGIQYFGARCNLPKVLLMALNGGRDEISGVQVGPEMPIYNKEQIVWDEDMQTRWLKYLKWLTGLYVNTMNTIHYMHDKYAYERLMMALIDSHPRRTMAFGIAGLSVLADSISAIKFANVKPIRNEQGLIIDFKIEGEFPQYGNDNDKVDILAKMVVNKFISLLENNRTYRNAEHTLSILTITSNVVYGKKTGSTPDGRKRGEPFAPGANPMHGRDKNGLLAVLNTCAKISYEDCKDGISLTISITPQTLGKSRDTRIVNLKDVLDGYFNNGAHHLNVNVMNRETLIDAMAHPENYPQLTIRVSGYAVNFNSLTKYQQEEVIKRTFYDKL